MSWLSSNIDYAKNLVDSGLAGACAAQENVLKGQCVGTVLSRSARRSWPPAAIGLGIGALCGFLASRRKRSPGTVVACGLIGGAAGFGAGMIWGTRQLTGSMAEAAMKNINGVRDARWLEKNPIDYA